MHYFIQYSGVGGADQLGTGHPVWCNVDSFPKIDSNLNLAAAYRNGDKEAIDGFIGSEIIFREKFIDFDYFDQYKNISICSSEFLRVLNDLDCDYTSTPIAVKTVNNKGKPIGGVNKKYNGWCSKPRTTPDGMNGGQRQQCDHEANQPRHGSELPAHAQARLSR